MASDRIKDLSKRELHYYRQLRREARLRESSQRCLLFGDDALSEIGPLVKVHVGIATHRDLLKAPPLKGVTHYLCPSEKWRMLSGFEAKRGVAIEVELPKHSFGRPARLVVCERVADPGNLGTIIRTARAFGYGGLVLIGACADPYNDKVLRASKGQALLLPWTRSFDLVGYRRIAAIAGGARPAPSAPDQRLACCFGNEGAGLSPELVEGAECVGIPMENRIESLNVAVAAAVIMGWYR
jgi:TrmH family RNA methyltransferase